MPKSILLVIYTLFSVCFTYYMTAQNNKAVDKDSIMKLAIKRSRSATRAEIGLGISHIEFMGQQWTTDFFSKTKDTIAFDKKRNTFTFSLGYAFPIYKFSQTKALGLNISLLAAVGGHTSLSIPTFLTIRFGGDATTYEFHKKIGFSVGIGPQMGLYTLTSLESVILTTPFIRPAYMAELSITPKFGMFKFRFIGQIGNLKKTVPYNGSSLGFTGSYEVSSITGLIVFTPFWAIEKHITKAFKAMPVEFRIEKKE